MTSFLRLFAPLCLALVVSTAPAQAESIKDFVGVYKGTAEFLEHGEPRKRDMSTTITTTKDGFTVSWTSTSYKSDGRIKEKSYTIEFVPSQRDNIFASAMKTNVFGKQVPLDPLKGEPFVWARLVGHELTVFSLFINEIGDYEMQEYNRSVMEGGLALEFRRMRNGVEERTVRTFLERQ